MELTEPLSSQADGRDTRLLAAQLELLAGVVTGDALQHSLEELLRVVEQVSAHRMLASVLLLDDEGKRLLHGAAPSLPADYNAAIHGIEIGPTVGSCGTAAFRRSQVIVNDIRTDPLWAEFRDLAEAAGLRACWSTPILGAGGRVLGTFAMYYPEPSSPSPADLALIDVLVRTVGMAIDRSRLDEQRERELAEERALGLTFQHSLLPEIPDRLGAVDLAARYRTGDPGVHVGGDWFDALELEDGLLLVVGDVQGHDVSAAALMGQLRTVVRATAAEGHPPAGILARAADYLDRLDTERLATVLVMHLDVEARLATIACAGHPPPLVLARRDGGMTVTALGVETGPPLGVANAWEERSSHLPPDSIVVLYTDGLVEHRRWSLDEGMDRLTALLEALPGDTPPTRVLDTALGLLPAGSRGDDVAVLAARIPPSDRAPAGRVVRSLPAQPMSVPLARSWAEGWLAGSPVPPARRDLVLLVVSEMVTNAVQQGDGPVRVALETDGSSLRVEVFDPGHRLPVLGPSDLGATGGRGLQLVDAFCDAWGVEEAVDGKTVWATLTW
jgi:anti-sigma regulatory factor (Ser/Thr protein kinase)